MTSAANKIRDAAARNSELLGVLGETEHAVPALEQQDVYIADLNRQLQSTEKQIGDLERKRAAELKDHEKYRDSVMKRFAYKVTGQTDKFTAKAAKEEREYFDVLQAAHRATEQKDSLVSMLSDAAAVRDSLDAEVSRHRAAQRDLDSLYDSIFTGPTPEFPDEDRTEHGSDAALHAYHESRARLETESQVLSVLGQARTRLTNALNQVEEALDCSRADMFGGGSITDMMERNALSKAESQASQMELLVAQAQRMSPQHVQALPPVRIAEGSLLGDVLFDNIFTDMAFHDKIKDSREELRRAGAALGAQFDASQSRRDQCEREVDAASEALKRARADLQKERECIFEQVQGGHKAAGEDNRTARGQADDAPPPY